MSLRFRAFLALALLAVLAAWQLFDDFRDQLKPAVQQATEDMLVETGAVLAPVAEADLRAGRMADGELARLLRDLRQRPLQAVIWGQEKRRADLTAYVTDADGIVLFDSTGQALGQDYSQWNDVHEALRGRYGARSTKLDPEDHSSTLMYVATPLRAEGRIVGVLTVAKAVNSLQPFVALGERNLSRQAVLVLVLTMLLAVVLAWWISRGLQRLVDYAGRVARGERAVVPATGSRELDRLAVAMEAMRRELDGKGYIESYIQALTHELRSPLTAIRASAELLEEELPADDRARFLGNLQREVLRAQSIVDRLLELARLEQRQLLESREAIPVAMLWDEVCRGGEAERLRCRIRIDREITPGLVLHGDRFLLQQALVNLLENALSFSPPDSTLHFQAQMQGESVVLSLRDEGPGIPDYALPRIFERFYSLPRPDTGKKSTGLGLSFVDEIAALHRGSVQIENHPEGGAVAVLSLPRAA